MIALAIVLASMDGAGGGPAWDPSRLSGLQAWYRADKGITKSGSNVTGWADSSGAGDSGRNLAVTTGTAPTFNAADSHYGGQPTVQFGTSGSITSIYLESGTWNATYDQPMTIFLVGNSQDNSTNNYALDNAGDTLEVYSGMGVLMGFISMTVAEPTNVPLVALIGAGGASSTIAVNAATAQTTGSDGGSPNATNKIRVGCYISGGAFSFGGPISELALFNRALTATERGNLVFYANARYGLSATGGIAP